MVLRKRKLYQKWYKRPKQSWIGGIPQTLNTGKRNHDRPKKRE